MKKSIDVLCEISGTFSSITESISLYASMIYVNVLTFGGKCEYICVDKFVWTFAWVYGHHYFWFFNEMVKFKAQENL